MEGGKSYNATRARGDEDSLSSRLAELRQRLLTRRESLNAEIRDYPTPISGCDAQFSHLLQERDDLSAGLRRLDAFAANPFAAGDSSETSTDFIESLESEFQE